MGIWISIFSDHNLEFASIDQIKSSLSERLNISCEFYSKGKSIERSELKFPSEYYFTVKEHADIVFAKERTVFITTNSKLLEQVRISKSAIKFSFPHNVRPKHHIWLDIITSSFQLLKKNGDIPKHVIKEREHWDIYLEHIESIASKLGASKILFLNDSSNYQQLEDELINGADFESVISKIDSNEKIKYQDLVDSIHKYKGTNICVIKSLKPADNTYSQQHSHLRNRPSPIK